MNRRTLRTFVLFAVAATAALLLAGCVPGDGTATSTHPANFLWGIWHGWVAPVTLIIGLFNHDIRVYETANTGWWYDLGFYLAVAGGFGSLTFFRGRRSSKRNRD